MVGRLRCARGARAYGNVLGGYQGKGWSSTVHTGLEGGIGVGVLRIVVPVYTVCGLCASSEGGKEYLNTSISATLFYITVYTSVRT